MLPSIKACIRSLPRTGRSLTSTHMYEITSKGDGSPVKK